MERKEVKICFSTARARPWVSRRIRRGRFQLEMLKAALGSLRETRGGWPQSRRAHLGSSHAPQHKSVLRRHQGGTIHVVEKEHLLHTTRCDVTATWHLLSDLILTTALRGRGCYALFFNRWGHWGSDRLAHLPKAEQGASGGVWGVVQTICGQADNMQQSPQNAPASAPVAPLWETEEHNQARATTFSSVHILGSILHHGEKLEATFQPWGICEINASNGILCSH